MVPPVGWRELGRDVRDRSCYVGVGMNFERARGWSWFRCVPLIGVLGRPSTRSGRYRNSFGNIQPMTRWRASTTAAFSRNPSELVRSN